MVQRPGNDVPARGHVVLASADSEAFTSLRRRSTSRQDRYRMGKELRRQVPRHSLGEWSARPDRPDPVQLIIESHRGRLDWLIPVRVGRMAASPYGFLRGAAIVMAEDVARLPSTGITPVICGDAHLGNFGFYASPERDLVIDLNDFDEAHPGGWEWDLRRLVASIWVAGRQNGASERQCESAVLQCVAGYRDEVRELASTPLLARSYQRLDVGSPAAERDGQIAAGRDQAGRGPGSAPDQRPGAAQVHQRARRAAPHRGGPAAGDPDQLRRGGSDRPRAGRVPGHPGPALAAGAGRLHADRHRPQGGGRRQRRAARLRRAAGGQQPR